MARKLFLPRSLSKNAPILPSPNTVSGTYHLRIGRSLSDPAGETQLTATYLVGFAFSTLGMTHAARKYISSLILENREHNLTFFRKPECHGADPIPLDQPQWRARTASSSVLSRKAFGGPRLVKPSPSDYDLEGKGATPTAVSAALPLALRWRTRGAQVLSCDPEVGSSSCFHSLLSRQCCSPSLHWEPKTARQLPYPTLYGSALTASTKPSPTPCCCNLISRHKRANCRTRTRRPVAPPTRSGSSCTPTGSIPKRPRSASSRCSRCMTIRTRSVSWSAIGWTPASALS